MHVGDLDASSAPAGNRWNASVTITIHDENENPVANATVTGTWFLGNRMRSDTCITNSNGQCTITRTIANFMTTATFSVDNVTGTLTYDDGGNHDPDGDSNGKTITVNKP
ncbi:MAG: hypothetical protein D6706_13480 [Chloroflexi bacterium]|nr:MAG: hypothetical protein D6706_13480 [Chloroflexota bacterium]